MLHGGFAPSLGCLGKESRKMREAESLFPPVG